MINASILEGGTRMRKRQMTLWAVRITFILLALTWQALGQAITGRLVGTIQDSSQAVVPDARVTITNSGTGISWDFPWTPEGNYVAPSLPPGALPGRGRGRGVPPGGGQPTSGSTWPRPRGSISRWKSARSKRPVEVTRPPRRHGSEHHFRPRRNCR